MSKIKPHCATLITYPVTSDMARDCLSKALSMVNLSEGGSASPVRDSRGWTVLHMAASHSKPQTVRWRRPLLSCELIPSCFRLLLQQGNKVGDRDQAGNTPLHLAAEAGNKEAARVLLHHGASVTERNVAGLTPLHVAAKNKHGHVAEILLQSVSQGAGTVDMNTSIGSRTSLHIAASEGAVQVV